MLTARRTAILGGLVTLAMAYPVMGCSAGEVRPADHGRQTEVYVLGTIHSGHRDSELYSLAVLESAIRKAGPDVILTEIPPDRIAQAISSFAATGTIDEPRTRVFPEYTDVVFPLSNEMDFEIIGTAGWTPQIADDRRVALDQIANDPARAEQWSEHLAARRAYARRVDGRGDDPKFIHTDEFDQLVEEAYRPYQDHFDADLGAGGWTEINRAHTDLIVEALGQIAGQGKRVLITFGTAHKYKIIRRLKEQPGIVLLDSRALFE